MKRKALLAISLLLTGCGLTGNTLAQDLAYERMKKCENVAASMIFQRIDTNGTVWVEFRSGNQGQSEWQACMRKAAQEQAAQRRLPAPPPQPVATTVQGASAGAAPFGAVLVPVLKLGDEWAFSWEDAAGKGTYIRSVDREEMVDSVSHYVVKTGTRESYYRRADLAFTHETVDGTVVTRYSPARTRYVWPLVVGTTWEQSLLVEKPTDRQATERVYTAIVEAEETVTVPAGTFKTFKIVYKTKATGAIWYEEWFSSELKGPVRLRENLASGLRVRELFAYKLK